jgi:hypothetical protein
MMYERDEWMTASPPVGATKGPIPAAHFYHCLVEGVCQAKQQQRALSVLVLQVPPLPEGAARKRRELEIALRLGVRREDLVGRLSQGTLAVLLPRSGQDAEQVAERLSQLLARMTGEPVPTGIAAYPNDGVQALDLLRTATWRSLAATARPPRDRDLERFLGWSSETPVPGSPVGRRL